MPIFQAMSKFEERRTIFESITVHDYRCERLVKVNSKIPTLLRLQLAKYSGDTGYSTATLMKFAGHADVSNVVSMTDNEHGDRHSPAGDGKVTSVKPTAPTTENPGASLSANSEEARHQKRTQRCSR
jgi:hypothetical protein